MIDVRLTTPINVSGEQVDVLTLSEPTVGHMMKIDNVKGNIAQGVALVSACAGLTPREVEQISALDFGNCVAALEPFLPGGMSATA